MKILLYLIFPTFLFSCLWVDGTTLDGKYTNRSLIFKAEILKSYIYTENTKTKLAKILKDKNISRTKLEQEEFDAVVLILKGKYKQSINKLLKLNKQLSYKYSIASNLGTAYELNGDNKEALKWITEGIKRDSNSHYGTEWLHQLILKTKIKLQNNPNYLKHNRIIPLPLKFENNSSIIIENKTYSINEIENALSYQLKERVIFIKPKDAVVADLLYTLARIYAQTSSVESGLKYLKLSKLYGFSQPELLKEKEALYSKIQKNHSWNYYYQKIFRAEYIPNFIALLSLILLLFIFIYKIYKKIYR